MHIVCQDLTYGYPGGETPLFKHFNWALEGPGFFSLFGLSGVGKSTLAKLISCMLNPDMGKILIGKGVTILYAHNSERLPGWDSIGKHLKKVTSPEKKGLLDTLVNEYRLEHLLNKHFSGLSMGQKNRVNLIRYLVQNFDVLMLDEVLSNVDEPTRHHVLSKIKELFPDKTFLYVSHNVTEVARFSKAVHIFPHRASCAIRSLFTLPGLDQKPDQKIAERKLQEKVYSILKAVSSGEPANEYL